MEYTIISILKDGERVVGAFGYDRERGGFKLFKTKALILATGGIGRAYKITSNGWENTGDGHSLAYHAGADLIDMEFVQFHPTGMVWRACEEFLSLKVSVVRVEIFEITWVKDSCLMIYRIVQRSDCRQ